MGWYSSAICTLITHLFHLKHLKMTTIYPDRIILVFFQIHSFPREKIPSFPFIPPRNHLDAILKLDPYEKKRVSVIYNMINDLKLKLWDKTKMAWEKDLGVELSEDMWQYSLERIHTLSLCIRHGLIQFKVLHRLHYSRDKLSKLYPTADGIDMFWSCPSLNDYWRQIFDVFPKICGQTITPDYHTAIFGVPPPGCKVSNLQTNALAFASLLTRRLILFNTFDTFLFVSEFVSCMPVSEKRQNKVFCFFLKRIKNDYNTIKFVCVCCCQNHMVSQIKPCSGPHFEQTAELWAEFYLTQW